MATKKLEFVTFFVPSAGNAYGEIEWDFAARTGTVTINSGYHNHDGDAEEAFRDQADSKMLLVEGYVGVPRRPVIWTVMHGARVVSAPRAASQYGLSA